MSVRSGLWLVILAGSVLFAAACGGGRQLPVDAGAGDAPASDSGGGPDAGGALTLRAFCEQLRKVDTARLVKCLSEPLVSAEALNNVDTCKAWEAAASEGHLVYDATEAAACLASYADRPCTGGSFGPCPGVVKGTVAAGAACLLARNFYIFSECAGDAECVGGPTISCGGTCVPHAKVGEPCGWANRCTLGTICSGNSRCAPPAKVGEPCGFSSVFLCDAGLFCSDPIAGGTCMPQHPTGACQFSGECTPPARCPSGGGACQLPSEVGDACGPDLPCRGGALVCGSDQKCRAFGSPGEPCAGSLKLCVVGTCGADGKCPVLGLGDFCSGNNAECGPNALCLYSTTESRYRCTASCL